MARSEIKKEVMKDFKGIVYVVLLMIFSLCLVACGGSQGADPAEDPQEQASETPDDVNEVEIADMDNDGIPDDEDSDRDGDGVDNERELELLSNPDAPDIIFVAYDGDNTCDGSKECPVGSLEKAFEIADVRYLNTEISHHPQTILLESGYYEVDGSLYFSHVQSIYGGCKADFSDNTDGLSHMHFKNMAHNYLMKFGPDQPEESDTVVAGAGMIYSEMDVVFDNLIIDHSETEGYIEAISFDYYHDIRQFKLNNSTINGSVILRGTVDSFDVHSNFIIGSDGGREYTSVSHGYDGEEIISYHSTGGTLLIGVARNYIDITHNTLWGGKNIDDDEADQNILRHQQILAIGFSDGSIGVRDDFENEVTITNNHLGCGEIKTSCEPLVVDRVANSTNIIINDNEIRKLAPLHGEWEEFRFTGVRLSARTGLLQFDNNIIELPRGNELCGIWYTNPIRQGYDDGPLLPYEVDITASFNNNNITYYPLSMYSDEAYIKGFCFSGPIGNVTLNNNDLSLPEDSYEVFWLKVDDPEVEPGTLDVGNLTLEIW